MLGTPRRIFCFVLGVYLLASFFSVGIPQADPLPGDHAVYFRKKLWAVVSLPRVLRGDEMYYLMMAHSLAGDGDLRLSDEYGHVARGGFEMGVYHAGRTASNIFQHFSRGADYTLLANHPFGLSIVLGAALWPLADTPWLEPAAIWLTALWGAVGVLVFLRALEAMGIAWRPARAAALLMAFATPWFSYSRTLYTEIYIGTAMLIVMLAVLRNRALWLLPFLVLMGWFKYPAMSLFFGAGAGEALWRRWRNFFIFGLTGAAVLVSVFAFNKYYFAGSGWVTRESGHVAARAGGGSLATAGAPIAWVPGRIGSNLRRLFTDYDKGLFPHCPLMFLSLAGLVIMFKRARRYFWLLLVVGAPWALVHISYRYLMAGESYTTRYLVPLVPLGCVALPWLWQKLEHSPRWLRYTASAIVAISLLNNLIAGFLPGLTFDRKPWEVWAEFTRVIAAVGKGLIQS